MAGTTLRCRNEHAFVTQAKPGNTVSCPACRVEGRGRVSCRVPKLAAGLDGRQAPADSDDTRLAGYWQRQAPAVAWQDNLGGDDGECGECGQPMRSAGTSTARVCLNHDPPRWARPTGATRRAAAYLASTAQRPSTKVAIRTEADDDAERAARVSLHTRREAVDLLVDQLETVTDPAAYDRGAYQQMAFEIGAVLRGYRPEIGRADQSALARITREIVAIRDSDQYRDLADEAEQVAERRERQQAAIEQAAAVEARQLEDQRQAELAEREAERDRQAQARREASSGRPTQVNGYLELAEMYARRTVARDRAVAAKGACGFKHRLAGDGTVPAERLYGIQETDWSGQGSGYQVPGTPEIRACGKHFEAAGDWIERPGQCPPGALTCYWELG